MTDTPSNFAQADAALAALHQQTDEVRARLDGYEQRFAAIEADLAALHTPPPSTTPPPAKVGPSGLTMPTTAPAGWRQIIAEDFDEAAARGTFPGPYARKIPGQRTFGILAYPDGYFDTSGRGAYSPANISVADSVLSCHLEQPASSGGLYRVACPVPMLGEPAAGGRWGYVTAAIVEFAWRADVVPWAKTVPLFWPSSQDNRKDGEINFPEATLDGTSFVAAFVHKRDAAPKPAPVEQWPATTKTIAADGRWHRSRIHWEGGQLVRFTLDGVDVAEWRERIPASPMRFVLQNETKLTGALSTLGAGRVQYDWVAAFVKS